MDDISDIMDNNKKIKILVIDDSAFYRQSLINLLEKSPEIEVIGIARDGLDAIRFLSTHPRPDLITLDLEMPKIDGITFFRWLMKNNPIPSIVISSVEGGKNALKALDMGAVDFIAKPSKFANMEFMKIEEELFEKIAAIADIPVEKLLMRAMLLPDNVKQESTDKGKSNGGSGETATWNDFPSTAVTIGSSTGGPSAVQKVLGDLPADFSCPVLISQHMPKGFTRPFAERLNRLSNITVKEACTGLLLEAGTAYICPGSNHMELFKNQRGEVFISLAEAVESDAYSPSVDTMMESVAEIFGEKTIGVILTGMGHDGLEGMRKIKKTGGHTIAEAEETALVFGMPKEVIEHNLADKTLPLQFVGREIIRYTS